MSVENNIKDSGKKVELGRKGEEIASNYLEDKGYIIIKRNYMIGHSDIDILARDNEFLVFIEVRTKSKKDRGMPEETLTKKKLRRMKNTAELYKGNKSLLPLWGGGVITHGVPKVKKCIIGITEAAKKEDNKNN